MTDLLPCPFCGGKPIEKSRPAGPGGAEFIAFVACYCGGYAATAHKAATAETEAEAKQKTAELWNRRASPWRPMSECPDDKQLILVMQGDDLLPNPNVQLAIGPTRTAMGKAIGWMPIPKWEQTSPLEKEEGK